MFMQLKRSRKGSFLVFKAQKMGQYNLLIQGAPIGKTVRPYCSLSTSAIAR